MGFSVRGVKNKSAADELFFFFLKLLKNCDSDDGVNRM